MWIWIYHVELCAVGAIDRADHAINKEAYLLFYRKIATNNNLLAILVQGGRYNTSNNLSLGLGTLHRTRFPEEWKSTTFLEQEKGFFLKNPPSGLGTLFRNRNPKSSRYEVVASPLFVAFLYSLCPVCNQVPADDCLCGPFWGWFRLVVVNVVV